MALDLDDMTAIAPRDSASLPDGWRTMRFGDVVRNVDTYDHNPLVSGLERYVGLEHLDPESLHVKRWGLIADGTSFTRRFAAGQVLFGKRRAYQRKAAVAAFDGICSGDILVFEANGARLLPELLPFIVQSDGFFAHALGTSAGSLSPRTKWRDLANYQFALPPLHEQRRIADILWAADASCEHWSDVIGPFAVLRQAALDDFFRGEGSATTAVPIVPLEDVCLMQNGRPFPSNDYCEEGTRLLRPGSSPKSAVKGMSPGRRRD